MSATIQVSPSGDTGALAMPKITPVLMIGTLGGGIIGYSLSKKHKILGTLVFASLGGWIGQYIQSGNSPA